MTEKQAPLFDRRDFLRATLLSAGAVFTGRPALEAFARDSRKVEARFVVVADTHVGSPGDAERLERVIPRLRAEAPAFVLHAGDVVESGVTDTRQVDTARRLLDRIDRPVHLVPGNHDVWGKNASEQRKIWASTFGPTDRVVRAGEWAFVGLDSLALAAGCDCRELQDEVLSFLENAAEKLDGRRTVLLYHVPELPVPFFGSSIAWSESALERWQRVLERIRPAAALAGHWHVGVKMPMGTHPLVIAPPISGRGSLPTGYLRCSIKGEALLCERVMIETANKRELPTAVRWFLLPEAKAAD